MSMSTGIKGVGFDLDGTLVNSLPGLAAAIDATLKSLGLPVAGEERVSHWIGNGANVLIMRALSWAGGESSKEYQDSADPTKQLTSNIALSGTDENIHSAVNKFQITANIVTNWTRK